MTVLANKQETFVGSISIAGVSTHWASFARVVSIYLHCHASRQLGFVGNHAMQFSKRPLGVRRVGSPLLHARLLAFFVAGSLPDICQLLQSDQVIGVLGDDAFRDSVIGVLLQPSLSSRNHHQTAGCRTSAFLLQALSQSRIMVRSGNYSATRVEGMFATRIAGYSQIAYTHVNSSTTSVAFWCWIRGLDFKGNQQVELLLGFVVPQLSGSNFSTMLDKFNVLVISRVGDNHTTFKSQDADMAIFFKAIVSFVVVGQCWRYVLWGLVKPFVALLGPTRFAILSILFHFRPETFVSSTHLAWDITSHLGRETKANADIVIGPFLQRDSVAHFSMFKSIFAYKVASITICQLCLTKLGKLFWCRIQFQFCRKDCSHVFIIANTQRSVKK